MVEFLRKFENRGTIISRVNSIIMTKSINLQLYTLNFVRCSGPLESMAFFRAQSIYREVYVRAH